MTASIELSGLGGDVAFLAITVAFFALAMALMRACQRIVGPDAPANAETLPSATIPAARVGATDQGASQQLPTMEVVR